MISLGKIPPNVVSFSISPICRLYPGDGDSEKFRNVSQAIVPFASIKSIRKIFTFPLVIAYTVCSPRIQYLLSHQSQQSHFPISHSSHTFCNPRIQLFQVCMLSHFTINSVVYKSFIKIITWNFMRFFKKITFGYKLTTYITVSMLKSYVSSKYVYC